MEIRSISNSLIKELKKEAKSRFLLFLDTPNLIKEAINSKLNAKYILQEQGKQFDFVPQNSQKLITVSAEVLDYLSTVKTNAGILGIFEYSKKEYKSPTGNYLVLDNVQDAGNVGTLIRSALGANFKTIYLIDCASVTNEKVVRSSAGAIFGTSIYEMSKSEFLQSFNQNNLYVATMNGQNIYNLYAPPPMGIVLGNEGKGVSKEIALLAQGTLSVPMQNGLESLNVAVSGSIIMYQIQFGGKKCQDIANGII